MPTIDWVATGASISGFNELLNKGTKAITSTTAGTLWFTGSTALNSLDSSYNMRLYFNAKVNSSLSYGSSVQLYNYGNIESSNWNQTISVSGTSSKTYSSNTFTFNKATSGIGTRADIAIRITPPTLGTITIGSFYLRITYTLNTYTITVNSNDSKAGSTSGTVSGKYKNDSVQISANPKPGYRFVQWSDGNTEATRTVKVSGNATYTATFEPILISSLDISSTSLLMKLTNKNILIHDYIDILYKNNADCGISNGTCEIQPNFLKLSSSANDCYVNSYGMSSPISDNIKKYTFSVEPNTEYTYTLNAKIYGDSDYQISVFYYDNNYNHISCDISGNSTAQEQFYTWMTPNNAAYASLGVSNTNAGYEIYFTNIFVYKGKIEALYNIAYLGQIIKPQDALNREVIWSSSNPAIVQINEETGVLTAISAGTTIITCTARDDTNGQISAQCIINVLPHSEGPKAYLGTTPVKICFGNDLITNYHFFLS